MVRVLFSVLLFIFLSSFSRLCKAQGYHFVIGSDSLYIPYDKNIELNVSFELLGYQKEDFKILPFTSSGLSRVYNEQTNQWVSENDLWTNMPKLESKIKIMFPVIGEREEVKLLVLNSQNTNTYETNTLTFWTYFSLKDYIFRLNERIISGKIP